MDLLKQIREEELANVAILLELKEAEYEINTSLAYGIMDSALTDKHNEKYRIKLVKRIIVFLILCILLQFSFTILQEKIYRRIKMTVIITWDNVVDL